jgi:hypothetical protein
MIELILEVCILFMYRKWNHVLKFYFNYSFYFTTFDKWCSGFFMLHQCRRREGSNNGLPRGIKCYLTQFMRFPYYMDLKIVHLFDTMHIRKNVTKTLWQLIDGRRDKEKIVKICNGIRETNHAMQSVI